MPCQGYDNRALRQIATAWARAALPWVVRRGGGDVVRPPRRQEQRRRAHAHASMLTRCGCNATPRAGGEWPAAAVWRHMQPHHHAAAATLGRQPDASTTPSTTSPHSTQLRRRIDQQTRGAARHAAAAVKTPYPTIPHTARPAATTHSHHTAPKWVELELGDFHPLPQTNQTSSHTSHHHISLITTTPSQPRRPPWRVWCAALWRRHPASAQAVAIIAWPFIVAQPISCSIGRARMAGGAPFGGRGRVSGRPRTLARRGNRPRPPLHHPPLTAAATMMTQAPQALLVEGAGRVAVFASPRPRAPALTPTVAPRPPHAQW